MPSARRVRLLTLAAIATVIFVLFYGSGFGSGRKSGQSADFYRKTMGAMQGQQQQNAAGQTVINSETGQRAGHIPADRDGDGDIDEDDAKVGKELQDMLQKLAQEAKDSANEKAGPKPDTPSKLVGVGNSAEGNRKPPAEQKPAADKHEHAPGSDPAAAESPAEQALHNILKRSPVIIFSKSYCPHSKRAKGILLEKYLIKPEPSVVELDEHPLGSDLQDLLEAWTGRRTVPNIMVNNRSISGADTIVDLDNHGALVSKIQDLGERKVEVSERFAAEQVKGAPPAP